MKLLQFSTLAAIPAFVWGIDNAAFASEDIIEKDVAIVGGGASGTYAAVRLREDLDTSVVVIEKENEMGGHANTYYDAESDTYVNYGVLAYLRYGHSAAFFERFDIPIIPYAQPQAAPVYVNIADGSLLSSYEPPSFNATLAAFDKWLGLIDQYSPELLPGFWNFWEPDEIPSELLQPFGEFAERYGLEAAYPTFSLISNLGVGGVRDVLTLYATFSMGPDVTKEFLNASLFAPEGYSNTELYHRAYDLLKEDVLLHSQVTYAQRNEDGVKLVLNCSGGKKKLVKAKRLLFTPPPSLKKLAAFDLDAEERQPLTSWTGTWSFTGVANIPSVPRDTNVFYYSPDAVPANHLDIRKSSETLTLESQGIEGEDIFRVLFATIYPISHADAKAYISAAVQNLTTSGTFNKSTDSSIDFLEFVDHNSVLWRQSKEELRSGIVQDIYSLQGHRSTWYTGGLWSADYTGSVWAFTDTVLPRMLKGLR